MNEYNNDNASPSENFTSSVSQTAFSQTRARYAKLLEANMNWLPVNDAGVQHKLLA